MGIREIKSAIAQLTPEEMTELEEWFDVHRSECWDRQIKEDAEAGRHDALIEEAKKDYELDYSGARPNRFANRLGSERVMVVLDPDVATVFSTPESVNNVLRALIATMPNVSNTTNALAEE
jgi:hypothetical protein